MIDGCPSGLLISEEEINFELSHRRPGNSPFTSPRKETDEAEILSGVYKGITTGAPISILIPNRDIDSTKYTPIEGLLRPGHAYYTYGEKYGHVDYRGGGRASARETACRVAAGAVAKKLLMEFGIELGAFLSQISEIRTISPENEEITTLRKDTLASPIFCPDNNAQKEMISLIKEAMENGDSLGGVIELRIKGLPATLGDPIYEKLDANLSKAMMTINASKGVEIGSGFSSAYMKGSEHNDLFKKNIDGEIFTDTNHAGGILGGISNGMPLVIRTAFKPTSSIMKSQKTLDKNGQEATILLPEGSRHDPCLAIRAVPVVEAMGALVLADSLLMNRSTRMLEEKSFQN